MTVRVTKARATGEWKKLPVLWVAVITLRMTRTARQAAVVPNEIRAHFGSISPASLLPVPAPTSRHRELRKAPLVAPFPGLNSAVSHTGSERPQTKT